jgi:superfamily II DNA/RNA helicase
MLDMGFEPQLRTIVGQVKETYYRGKRDLL